VTKNSFGLQQIYTRKLNRENAVKQKERKLQQLHFKAAMQGKQAEI